MNTNGASPLTAAESSALTRKITRMSLTVALVLTLLKSAAWLAGGSVAMLSSLVDSSLDLLAAMTTFVAVRYAVAPPDNEHRFGHGKAEAFASFIQAGLVFASASLVGREAVERIVHPTPVVNSEWGMAVMAVSILLTGLLIVGQSRVLRRTRSVAVTGDRVHYIIDLASNVIALAGIGLSALLHSSAIDAAAGLIVVGWLVWGAVRVFRSASVELMDRELDIESRRRIIDLITEDSLIKDVHQLRTRAAGPYIHIQLHADLDPMLSLVEAHRVIVAAEKRLLRVFPAADILIHADPRGQAEPHGGAFAEDYDFRPESLTR